MVSREGDVAGMKETPSNTGLKSLPDMFVYSLKCTVCLLRRFPQLKSAATW